MKTCTGECGLTLPLEAFGPSGKASDGRQSRCRKCLAAAARRRRSAKPDAQARARQRQEKADLAACGLKRCARSTCRKVLPVEDFFVGTDNADGRYPYCRGCCKDIDAARRPTLPWTPPTYSTVHQRLPSLEGRTCRCCDDHAEEWAYDHGDPEELTDEIGRPYSLDQGRYMPMCRRCHRAYDSAFKHRGWPVSGRTLQRWRAQERAGLVSGRIARELAELTGKRGAA